MGRHENMPTEQLKVSAAAVAKLARDYAATGPKIVEDQLHETLDEVIDELAVRGVA